MHAPDIASWLVRAKVSPPKQLLNVCRRDGLLDRVAVDERKKLVVLDAPAGFGKTLLLSQLREIWCAKQCRVAWLTVDETDEPDIFVPYLAFAFHHCGVDMLGTGLLSSSCHGVRAAYNLGRLLNCIESSAADCVLVLDDAERMRKETIAEVINPLLRIQPDNLRICIAYRTNPGISLSNLAVRDDVLTLFSNDLRFSRSEISSWFGDGADETSLDTLVERTEGWPVALQLVRSSTDQSKPLTEQLSRLASTGQEPATYIREQLLSQLHVSEARFLRNTSILQTVRADAADSIRDAADSQSLMQCLHRKLEGLFAPLEQDDAFRLHPLIREHLQDELREDSSDRFRTLQRAAAAWLAQNGQGLSAMRHAISAEAPELAAAIFEGMGGSQLLLREGMSRLNAALALLHDYALEGFPRIQLARSLNFAKNGDMKSARQALRRARSVSQGFRHDRLGGNDAALLVDGYFVDLLLTEYGCAPTADALADDTWNVVIEYARTDPALHAYIMTWRCLSNVQSGHFDDAVNYGMKALQDFRGYRSRYGELFIYLHFGTAELARGRTGAALEEYMRASRIHRSEFPGDTGVRMICDIAMGEAYWERGDHAAARKYLHRVAKQVRHAEAWFDLYMAAYACCARFLYLDSGLDSALAYLGEAREHALAQELKRLESFLDALEFLLFYDAGLDGDATRCAERHRDTLHPALRPMEQITWRELEVLSLARARAGLLSGREDLADRRISELAQVASATGNVRLEIQSLIQGAALLCASGERAGARAALRRALVLARRGRYLRPFIDQQRRIRDPLDDLAAELESAGAADEAGLRELLNDLFAAAEPQRTGTARGGLSPRELEIIGELSRGWPDKRIARAVGLSAHGVRYHLKNIYSKLGVRNRVQAVSRARKMGLLQ